MADVRQALRSLLLADSTLSSLISTRLYADQFPQSLTTFPSVMYDVSRNPTKKWVDRPSDMNEARIVFAVAARSKSDVIDVKKAIQDAIDGYSGTPENGFYFHWIAQVKERDMRYRPIDGTDQYIYELAVEYRVKHRVTIN